MDNCFDLKETRNNLVAKDNRMIQNSRFALNSMEHKAVLYLISKIQPEDPPGKRYLFNCKEFQALVKWNGAASYKNIKAMLTKLANMSWWVEIDDGQSEALVRWFNIIHMNKGTGDVEISFHEEMFPYLLNLQRQLTDEGHYFTTYRLQNVTLMKNRYSPRIYEILKSYQFNNKKWTFENGTGTRYDLQRRIADTVFEDGAPVIPKNWRNWAIFRRDVIEPAVKEINKYTDIKVSYQGKKEDIHHRKTRAIRTIEFYMAGKTEPEQRETDSMIDAEYIEINEYNSQQSIEEEFFRNHEKKLAEEKKEKEAFAALQKEKEIDNSKHPVLASCLIEEEFTEEQLDSLYNAAIRDRVAGIIKFNQWELFAADVVSYYFSLVKATPEDTETTVYKRLFNMVRKDYEMIVPEFQERYSKIE